MMMKLMLVLVGTAAFMASAADLAFLKELVEIPNSSVDYPQVNRATDARCFVSCKVPVVNIGHEHGDSHAATEWATADSIDVVTRYLTAFFLSESR